MRQSVTDSATESAADWIAWAMLAAGVTFHPFQYAGGLFFAFACAMLARHWLPDRDRREVWVTLLAAFLVATIGAEFYDWWFADPPLPIQMTMAALGFCSRVAVTLAMKLLMRTEARSGEIADRLIDGRLPGGK